MQMKAILLAYLKTVRSSNNCPGNNGRGLCVLLQCDRVGFRNMQPRLAEAAEMLGAKAESTEQYGGAALMLLLWKPDCSSDQVIKAYLDLEKKHREIMAGGRAQEVSWSCLLSGLLHETSNYPKPMSTSLVEKECTKVGYQIRTQKKTWTPHPGPFQGCSKQVLASLYNMKPVTASQHWSFMTGARN